MMKTEHRHLDELYRAYATTSMMIDDKPVLLYASEEKDYPCYMYSGDDFSERSTVWEHGGGCMSIIPIPNRKNEFLAIVDFYLKESPSKAKLIWGRYHEGSWIFEDVIHLPYLHRFDIFNIDGVNHVVLATIADEKDFKEDWTRSGSIYRAQLPDVPSDGLSLTRLEGSYFRNHGYSHHDDCGYFTSDEGVFKLDPRDNWSITKVLDGPVGEVALIDINNDGIDELMTIEPFHGNAIKIYEKKEEGYQAVYHYNNAIDFAHTLIATTIKDVPTFIAGVRRMDTELFMVQYIDGEYVTTVIDHGGPANLAFLHTEGRDYILSANHTRNECALYEIT